MTKIIWLAIALLLTNLCSTELAFAEVICVPGEAKLNFGRISRGPRSYGVGELIVSCQNRGVAQETVTLGVSIPDEKPLRLNSGREDHTLRLQLYGDEEYSRAVSGRAEDGGIYHSELTIDPGQNQELSVLFYAAIDIENDAPVGSYSVRLPFFVEVSAKESN